MESYFCPCLNVIINVKEKETRKIEGKKLVLFNIEDEDDIENLDNFFQEELLDVVLSYSGIEVAHSFLTNERCFGDWLISTCLNCGTETHAIHAVKGFDRVIVRQDIPTGRKLFNETKQEPSYSKIFKLKIVDSETRENTVLSSPKINIVDATNKVTSAIKKSILAEQEAMEERIRIYREKQQQQLREFKMKAYVQKEDMLKTIKQYESNTSHDSLFDTLNETYFGNASFESRDISTELPRIHKIATHKGMPPRTYEHSDNSSPIAMSLPSRMNMPMSRTQRYDNQPKFSPNKQRSYSETSDDTLFDLDGFQPNRNCEPFYESDEDSSGDATSLESSGGFNIPSRNMRPGDRVYATSVPVSVPLFQNSRNSYEPESDDDDNLPSPSPTHIAESIQAIAKSMQDSTSMFGELPRPRLNTQPFSLR